MEQGSHICEAAAALNTNEDKKAVLEPRNVTVNFDTYLILQEVNNGTFMYAKHGNLVDMGASGTKANTKHLESYLEVTQSHALGDH